VAHALVAAHAAGIVPGTSSRRHPAREDGTVKITDFGISARRATSSVTKTG